MENVNENELDFILSRFKSTFIVCEKKFLADFEKSALRVPNVKNIIVLPEFTESVVEKCLNDSLSNTEKKFEELNNSFVIDFVELVNCGKNLIKNGKGKMNFNNILFLNSN